MKYKSKFLSVFLVFSMLFAFSGCLKYSSNLLDSATTRSPFEGSSMFTPGTTAAPDPTAGTVPQEPSVSDNQPYDPSLTESTSEMPDSTTLPTESTSVPPESTTEIPSETTTEPPVEVDPASWSKSEIIDFITEAVNKTKAYTGTVSVHRTEELGVTIEEISPNLPAVKSIANSIISRVIRPIDETLTFTGGTTVNSEGETLPFLLPKRQSFVLPESGVASARASKNGDNIEVNITLVSELSTLNQLPTYNSGTMGYLDLSVVDLSMLTIEKLDITYSGSTMKAIVNPDGYVISADYNIPIAIDGGGRIIGLPGGLKCTGYQIETWQINW